MFMAYEKNIVCRGKSACSGVAIGKLYYHDSRIPHIAFTTGDPAIEHVRLDDAFIRSEAQLASTYERARALFDGDEADVFAAHLAILRDNGFRVKIRGMIDEKRAAAEYAVCAVAEEYARMFEQMEDEYLKERAADMRAVGGKIIDALGGAPQRRLLLNEPVILAAEDLMPDDTIGLDRRFILGLVTERGGVNSHTAILARALGIPAVVGAALSADCHGKMACLDGFTGEVIIEPDVVTMRRLRLKRQEWEGMRRETLAPPQGMLCFANVSSLAEAEYAAELPVAGIGLFRTEFLFLGREAPPGEEEQFRCYRDVLKVMRGKPVVFRLADLGADKTAPHLNIKKEQNPAMGMRGVRFLLTRREYLRTQLRALYRASIYGTARILVPMVTSCEEMIAVRAFAARVQNELKSEGIPVADHVLVGAMIETPAAALCAHTLCGYSDFFSIGTNDLAQYTLAADRQMVFMPDDQAQSEDAAWAQVLCDPAHPAVCRLIEMTAAAANTAGVDVCICGELGANKSMAGYFKEIGIHAVSVSLGALTVR